MDAEKPKHNYEQIRQIINERISLMDEKMGGAGGTLSEVQKQIQPMHPKVKDGGKLWQRLRTLLSGSHKV